MSTSYTLSPGCILIVDVSLVSSSDDSALIEITTAAKRPRVWSSDGSVHFDATIDTAGHDSDNGHLTVVRFDDFPYPRWVVFCCERVDSTTVNVCLRRAE